MLEHQVYFDQTPLFIILAYSYLFLSISICLLIFFLSFSHTASSAQGLRLPLCLGVASGGALETIWESRN